MGSQQIGDLVSAHGAEIHFLKFRNNRLVYADLDWYTSHTRDVFDAVVGALSALAQQNEGAHCLIVPASYLHPESSANRVGVVCGERSILIGK
jgi:hypothetical protein